MSDELYNLDNEQIQACLEHSCQWPIDTGKSFSEALILASTHPQYDKRLFIELQLRKVHENFKLRTCCVHKSF